MDLPSIIIIAIGLAMDCFAVSVSEGVRQRQWNTRILLMALLFGLFQGGMPLITFYIGSFFASFISRFSPWIALTILSILGGNMLLSAFRSLKTPTQEDTHYDLSITRILLLAIATSIDALATGVLFVATPQQLLTGIIIIAFVSFIFSLIGFALGKYMGKKIPFSPDWIAGSLLILIGLKIFISSFF